MVAGSDYVIATKRHSNGAGALTDGGCGSCRCCNAVAAAVPVRLYRDLALWVSHFQVKPQRTCMHAAIGPVNIGKGCTTYTNSAACGKFMYCTHECHAHLFRVLCTPQPFLQSTYIPFADPCNSCCMHNGTGCTKRPMTATRLCLMALLKADSPLRLIALACAIT